MNSIKLSQLQPFVRFAQPITYRSSGEFSHASDTRLYYVLEGSGSLCIGDKSYPLDRDAVLLVQPGTPYCFEEKGAVQQLIALNFDYDWSRSEILQVLAPVPVGSPLQAPAICLQVEECPALGATVYLRSGVAVKEELLKLIEVRDRQQRYFQEEVSCLLKHVLIRLVQLAELKSDRSERVVQDVLDYIREHYADPISPEMLGERFSYSDYHLNRLMRQATGTTIHQYLMNYRITMAQQLLLETDAPIGQIARQVGFAHFAHFSSCFLKITGYRPSDYRALVCGRK